MEKIFTEFDLAEMRVASDFRFVRSDDDSAHWLTLTEGITPNLVAEVHSDWLDTVIDRIIERR